MAVAAAVAASCGAAVPAAVSSPAAPSPSAAAVSSSPVTRAGAATAAVAGVVTWVHIGDLHIQTADMQNYKDFGSILGEIDHVFAGGVDFALLPGDNANEGSDAEYQLIGQAIENAALPVPLYAIKGDHDEKSSTQAFEQYLSPQPYYSHDIGGYHFIFLEAMNKSGDSSLTPGSAEWRWFGSDLKAASAAGRRSVIVMHPYFLTELPDATDFQSLVQQSAVLMVDSGHTHTNDLANDGRIVYSATRSTGQDTEGPVGVSVVTVDQGTVSWKFAPLGAFPFVEITSPGDSALITGADGIAHGQQRIDAKAFSTSPIRSASYQVDGGTAVAMSAGASDLWSAAWDSTAVPNGQHKIAVTVTDSAGKTATDSILAKVDQTDTFDPGTKTFGPAANLLLATDPDIAAKGIVVTSASAGGPPKAPPPGGGKPGRPGGSATVQGVSGNAVTLKLADGSTTTITLGPGVEVLEETPATGSDLVSGATVQLVGPPGSPAEIVILPTGSPQTSRSSATAALATPVVLALGLVVVVAAAGVSIERRRRARRSRISGTS